MNRIKKEVSIQVLASYSIFSIIVSTLLVESFQLSTIFLSDIVQAYLYIYLFLFMPLFIVIFIVVLQLKIYNFTIVVLSLLTLLILFVILTSISMYNVDTSYTSLVARFINIFKFLPVYVLQLENFGQFALVVNVAEILIFLSLFFVYKQQ
jgi:hypothetical protein